jgi:hypothetical protein
MRFLRTLSIGIYCFSASPAIQKNIFIHNTRFLNRSIIRYGRSAIGARISSKGSIFTHKRKTNPVTVSRIYRSNVLSRALFPRTSAAVGVLFINNNIYYILLHNNYIHNFYIRNNTIESTCILSFIMHSPFTRYKIVPGLITCFSSKAKALFTLVLFSRTAIRYYEVPIEHGFFLRTTAIRFNARRVITNIALRVHTHTRIAHRVNMLNRRALCQKNEYLLNSSLKKEKKRRRRALITEILLFRSQFSKKKHTKTNKKQRKKLSFYENSIVEINKIAFLGKRVFRNATSSRKVKFSLRGNYIDELFESTRSGVLRKHSRRRQYMFRRSRRILRKIARRKFCFRRFRRFRLSRRMSQLLNSNAIRSKTADRPRPRPMYFRHHSVAKRLLTFFYSLVLREKLSLRMREKYPFDAWVRKHGAFRSTMHNSIKRK